jgi:hypothetical protein
LLQQSYESRRVESGPNEKETPSVAAAFARAADDAQGKIIWGAINTLAATWLTAVGLVGISASPFFYAVLVGAAWYGRTAWKQLNSGLSTLERMKTHFERAAEGKTALVEAESKAGRKRPEPSAH